MATTATKRDGKVYINGTKTFNTSADKAPYMLCVARSGINESPYKDFSMYLFPMDRPGITISKLSKIGNNMCGTYEVYLQDVECDESDLVGEECKGFYQLMKNFEVERLTICAANVGMAPTRRPCATPAKGNSSGGRSGRSSSSRRSWST